MGAAAGAEPVSLRQGEAAGGVTVRGVKGNEEGLKIFSPYGRVVE